MDIKDYNLELIESMVGTQYGDYGGYIQIDGHGGTDLFKLCEDHDIDMEKYFLIGMSGGEHTTTGIGNRDKLHLTALLLEKALYGNSFDEIKKNLQSKSRKVTAHKIHFSINYADLGKYIKRFDFMVATKLTKHISEIEILDNDE